MVNPYLQKQFPSHLLCKCWLFPIHLLQTPSGMKNQRQKMSYRSFNSIHEQLTVQVRRYEWKQKFNERIWSEIAVYQVEQSFNFLWNNGLCSSTIIAPIPQYRLILYLLLHRYLLSTSLFTSSLTLYPVPTGLVQTIILIP